MRLIVVMIMALVLVGCASTMPAPGAYPDTAVKGPESGKASSDIGTNDMPVAGGYNGAAGRQKNVAMSNKVSPQRQNTGTGSLVTAFIQGATPQQEQAAHGRLMAMLESDEEIAMIRKEMKWLMDAEEYSPDWQTRADALKLQYREARDRLVAMFETTSGLSGRIDLGKLRVLVNVGIISGNVGHTEREPSADEMAALKAIVPELVKAAALVAEDDDEDDQ